MKKLKESFAGMCLALCLGLFAPLYTIAHTPAADDYISGVASIHNSLLSPQAYVAVPAKIEAENYSNQNGIQTSSTSDVGGGSFVGWTDGGDWIEYDINVTTAGNYSFDYRLASPNTGKNISLMQGSAVLHTFIVPNTGDWQTWQTVTQTATLSAGQYTIRLATSTGGWNINWMDIKLVTPAGGDHVPVPAKIQAEDFTAENGTQLENTSDVGGGQNVGWLSSGDWLEYRISVPTTGNYTFDYRLAATSSGKKIDLMKGSTLLHTVTVPNTGGWQNWQTVSQIAALTAGQYTIRLTTTTGSWNINWLDIKSATPVNQAPTVSLTAPANNATFTAGQPITITANATDADGTIAKVEFYKGSTKLGEDNLAPYSYTWNGATQGNHSLTAKAIDNGGAITTSSARTITVNPPAQIVESSI